MNTKKIIAALVMSAMMCGTLASCGSSDDDSSSNTATTAASVADNEADTSAAASEADTTEAASEADTTEAAETTAPPQAVADPAAEDIEESIAAQSGEAYLAINEGQGWIQYFGVNDDADHTMLTYGAKNVPITGNGSYTVGVTTDTNGFRFDTTGDVTDGSAVPAGLMFSAVIIKDGKTKFPDAIITIDSIKVDGKDIPLIAKNYTSSDDGKELRSNIYNQWVKNLPDDAASTEGALVVDGTPTEAAAAYSPCIVNTSDFASWHDVEVNFTISGLAE